MIAITQLDVEHYEVALDGAPDGTAERTLHRIRLTPEHWRALTERRVTPEGVLMEAMRFLLTRENGAELPAAFDLADLAERHPDWRVHLAAWLERGR